MGEYGVKGKATVESSDANNSNSSSPFLKKKRSAEGARIEGLNEARESVLNEAPLKSSKQKGADFFLLLSDSSQSRAHVSL